MRIWNPFSFILASSDKDKTIQHQMTVAESAIGVSCASSVIDPSKILEAPASAFGPCQSILESREYAASYDKRFLSPARLYAKEKDTTFNIRADSMWAIGIASLEYCAGNTIDKVVENFPEDMSRILVFVPDTVEIRLTEKHWGDCKDPNTRSHIIRLLNGLYVSTPPTVSSDNHVDEVPIKKTEVSIDKADDTLSLSEIEKEKELRKEFFTLHNKGKLEYNEATQIANSLLNLKADDESWTTKYSRFEELFLLVNQDAKSAISVSETLLPVVLKIYKENVLSSVEASQLQISGIKELKEKLTEVSNKRKQERKEKRLLEKTKMESQNKLDDDASFEDISHSYGNDCGWVKAKPDFVFNRPHRSRRLMLKVCLLARDLNNQNSNAHVNPLEHAHQLVDTLKELEKSELVGDDNKIEILNFDSAVSVIEHSWTHNESLTDIQQYIKIKETCKKEGKVVMNAWTNGVFNEIRPASVDAGVLASIISTYYSGDCKNLSAYNASLKNDYSKYAKNV